MAHPAGVEPATLSTANCASRYTGTGCNNTVDDGIRFREIFFNHFLFTRKLNILNNVTIWIAGMYIILKKQIYEAK